MNSKNVENDPTYEADKFIFPIFFFNLGGSGIKTPQSSQFNTNSNGLCSSFISR